MKRVCLFICLILIVIILSYTITLIADQNSSVDHGVLVNPIIYKKASLFGALEGIVIDSECDPIEGVRVTANNADYNPVYTNEDGYYTIDPMEVGLYDIQYYKSGYPEAWYYDVKIDSGETTIQNVVLGTIPPPPNINVTLPVGDSTTRIITIPNYGNEPLDWSASIEDQTELRVHLLNNSYKGPTSSSSLAEIDPNPVLYNPPTDDMWDILFSYDVDTPTGGIGIAGAEFGNGYFLVSEWGYQGNKNVYKFDAEGNYISSWVPTWMPGTTGLRDMAFDGQYFYGSNAGNTIYQFDEDGNLYGTITSPVNVRSIAYESDNDAFWVNNWDQDLKLIDRSGNVLHTISSPQSMYGSAYDNISDGGPYLWIFTGTSICSGCQIEQYDLNTMTLTGVSHSVSGDFPETIFGGLFTSGDIVHGTWVLGGIAQGSPDLLFGYELDSYLDWISIDPTSGTVDPLSCQDVTVYLYANNDPAGTIHTCNIVFESSHSVIPIIIPVTLTITDTLSSGNTFVSETILYPNFPNPVLNTTTFSFSLKERSHVTLSVYNIKGQLVEILLDEELEPTSSHNIEWDGTVNGRKCANCIYFYKLETDRETFLKTMILTR